MLTSVISPKTLMERRIVLVFVLFSLVGCVHANDPKQADQNDGQAKQKKPFLKWGDLVLLPKDHAKFRPGRAKDDILKEIHGKGSFIEATEHDGKSISSINFNLFGSPHRSIGGSLIAIFVDDKFQKFVRYPDFGRIPERIKIGEHFTLLKAFERDAVTIPQLEKEMKENPPPRSIDWGLTAVFLILRPGIKAAEAREEKAKEKSYIENEKLREQLDASKLKIGMTEKEVQKALAAKSIHSGKVEAGTFKIYGSTKSFEINGTKTPHYSNVLVVYKKGKVTSIYGFPGGEEGIELSRQSWFSDLPPRKRIENKFP